MWRSRQLLYHRGVDDHPGTYITDYVIASVCGLLCIHLLIRMRREKRNLTEDQREKTSCSRFGNLLPWNWPKSHATPVTMATYGVLLIGVSNMMMALLGGLTHQYLQTVEPYSGDVKELWGWLIVWRIAASFSAVFCWAMFVMTEQLITQEELVRIPRCVRQIYYVIIFLASIGFFFYNFLPLMTKMDDPFSIGKSFIVVFAVMFVYGIVSIIPLIRRYCCCCCRKNSQRPSAGAQYSPAHSVNNTSPERSPHKNGIYAFCKTVVVTCHASSGAFASRKLELILTATSPWLYILSGVINQFMKSKCSDADDAYAELGCPLPNAFNHNSLMHVIQIFAVIGFFAAEHISMTRRRQIQECESTIKRVGTSSTIYNDNCVVTNMPDAKKLDGSSLDGSYLNNNNKPLQSRDDIVCEVTTYDDVQETINELESVQSLGDDVTSHPKFPTTLPLQTDSPTTKRGSVYDNVVPKQV